MTDRSPESTTSVTSPADERPQPDSPEHAENPESPEHPGAHSDSADATPRGAEESPTPETPTPEAPAPEAPAPGTPDVAEPDDAPAAEPEGRTEDGVEHGDAPAEDAPAEQPSGSPAEDAQSAEGSATAEDSASREDAQHPAPDPPDAHPMTGGVRLSRPTPALPPESRPEEKDTGVSDFFDTLDERFAEATGRLTGVFRRPEPGEQITARVDAELLPDHDIPPAEAPQDPSVQDDLPPDADVSGPTYSAQDLPAHLEEEDTDDVDLPDEAAASQLDSYQEQARPVPPRPMSGTGPGDEATMVALPPIDAQTGDPRTSRIALPRPPAGDRRPLPWEAREQEAEQGRQQDASAARRRAMILEKAAAIEAATRQEEVAPEESADDEEDLYTYIPPYNLPSRDPDPVPRRTDLIRQIFVSVSALAALLSAWWMLGFLTGPAIIGGDGLETLVGGWYSGDLALLTPDAGHYWLWPVIALCLVGHAVHQWTTTQISTPRQRRSGWLVGLASILMLVWTAAVHAGLTAVAVLAALAAALALVDAVRQFTLHTARNAVERRLTDAVVGLFTGWALVGAMSSVSATLTMMGVRIPGFPAILWAMIGLIACIWVGAYYAMTERGRMTIALGLGWGMFWLIFPRLLSETPSVWVAIGAAMGAFIVILATESRRHRINHAERRAAMGRPVDDII